MAIPLGARAPATAISQPPGPVSVQLLFEAAGYISFSLSFIENVIEYHIVGWYCVVHLCGLLLVFLLLSIAQARSNRRIQRLLRFHATEPRVARVRAPSARYSSSWLGHRPIVEAPAAGGRTALPTHRQ